MAISFFRSINIAKFLDLESEFDRLSIDRHSSLNNTKYQPKKQTFRIKMKVIKEEKFSLQVKKEKKKQI